MNNAAQSLIISNRSSIVGIDLYEPSSNSIVVQRDSNQNGDQVCIYFPQLREVVYAAITTNTRDFTLTDFVTHTLKHQRTGLIGKVDPGLDQFVVSQFDIKQKEIASGVLVRWKKRFQVVFHKEIVMLPSLNTTCILIQTGKRPQQTIRIHYEQYKKMRLREFFLYHRLAKYRYTALSICGNIVKNHETLQGFQMLKGVIKTYALISFQTFYHEMHNIYNKLKQSDFDFESLFNTIIQKNPPFQRMLREKYPLLKSTYIDQFTQYCILYLTSNFYKPQQQKQLLQSYSSGKFLDPLNQPQIILVAFMLSRIEQLNNPGDCTTIYLIQKIQEEQNKNQFKIDEIIRFEAFAPAFSNRPQNIEKKGCDIYQIQHLTSQYIGIYNGLHNNYNYIILPYTEYYVENIQQIKGNKEIKLIQISYPKHLDTDLVLWIDDKLKEGLAFKNEYLNSKKHNIEIVFLKSNKLYEFWLKKYYNMLSFRRVKVITNMRRGQDDYAGIETIKLTRLYLHSDISIMMFVGRANQCIQLLKQNKVQHYEEILVTDNPRVMKEFILSEEIVMIEKEENMDNCNCSIKEGSKCQIF